MDVEVVIGGELFEDAIDQAGAVVAELYDAVLEARRAGVDQELALRLVVGTQAQRPGAQSQGGRAGGAEHGASIHGEEPSRVRDRGPGSNAATVNPPAAECQIPT